jgi:formate/nitrite transporter FocA (FNT family)
VIVFTLTTLIMFGNIVGAAIAASVVYTNRHRLFNHKPSKDDQ